MALATTIVWEVQTGGSDTNGGGYKPGSSGTDWTQQAAAQYAVADAVTAGTTTITSATASFGTDVVGNVLYIQGGTGGITAGWYEIISRTNATTIVVDRSTGLTAGTGATLNIGGALASIGGCKAAGLTSGHICYVKNGTYSITTATINVSGGVLSDTLQPTICGYGTTRTLINTDTKPLIQYGVAGVTMFSTRGLIINLALDGNAQTTAKFDAGLGAGFYRCSITNMNSASGSGTYIFCSATTNSVGIFVGHCAYCEAYSNTASPFLNGNFVHCISYNNSGGSTDGFQLTGSSNNADFCSSYGNGQSGFSLSASARPNTVTNSHAENNTTYGFNITTNAQALVNCSAYNNTSGKYPALLQSVLNLGFIDVTDGSVFTNAGTTDFSLNNTTLRGALLRAAGFPTAFPVATTLAYSDIGAVQHQDSPSTTFIYNVME